MKVIVIGGGAAGLMAAYAAADRGCDVLLLEKNEKLGKKIYITGKGRCNLTNDRPPDEFLENVVRGRKFLTGALYRLPPKSLMALFEENGLPLKTERGRRVFPVSDHASDVTKTLETMCKRRGVTFLFHTPVEELLINGGSVVGVRAAGRELGADTVILATGGKSYPSTGSTGDGYRFAEACGHTVVPPVPSLVGLNASGMGAAQGISLKNCVLTAKRADKLLFSEMGELLFTHYGISGPLVLSLSAVINRLPIAEIGISIDMKPALDEAALNSRLVSDFASRKNEQMKNVMRGLLPAGLCTVVLKAAKIAPEKQANAVTKEERAALVAALKAFPVRASGLRPFEEAVVTSGGVSLSEVDPKTMASRKMKGLRICGEVLDVDALTGGFNLHIAFATGFAAGNTLSAE